MNYKKVLVTSTVITAITAAATGCGANTEYTTRNGLMRSRANNNSVAYDKNYRTIRYDNNNFTNFDGYNPSGRTVLINPSYDNYTGVAPVTDTTIGTGRVSTGINNVANRTVTGVNRIANRSTAGANNITGRNVTHTANRDVTGTNRVKGTTVARTNRTTGMTAADNNKITSRSIAGTNRVTGRSVAGANGATGKIVTRTTGTTNKQITATDNKTEKAATTTKHNDAANNKKTIQGNNVTKRATGRSIGTNVGGISPAAISTNVTNAVPEKLSTNVTKKSTAAHHEAIVREHAGTKTARSKTGSTAKTQKSQNAVTKKTDNTVKKNTTANETHRSSNATNRNTGATNIFIVPGLNNSSSMTSGLVNGIEPSNLTSAANNRNSVRRTTESMSSKKAPSTSTPSPNSPSASNRNHGIASTPITRSNANIRVSGKTTNGYVRATADSTKDMSISSRGLGHEGTRVSNSKRNISNMSLNGTMTRTSASYR